MVAYDWLYKNDYIVTPHTPLFAHTWRVFFSFSIRVCSVVIYYAKFHLAKLEP
jgi:hypothetical protein